MDISQNILMRISKLQRVRRGVMPDELRVFGWGFDIFRERGMTPFGVTVKAH